MKLADLPNPELTQRLMSDQAADPVDEQASSHWRQMHRGTVAQEGGEGPKLELLGQGFGNVQRCHPAQIPLEWVTSVSHWLLSEGQLDLPEAAGVLRRLFRRMTPELRLKLTFDAIRQAFAWQTIRPFLPARSPMTWCLVGDGFGVFAALIKEFQPEAVIYLVDLPKTLVFQTVYVQMMHPRASHSLLEEGCDTDFVYCPASQFPRAPDGIDVFVNVNSMQEMTRPAIQNYFDQFRITAREDSLFYCCNRIEKRLPGGEVIRFSEYPWRRGDEILLDGPCPYQRFFFHLRTLSKGPRCFGARIPFINHFDGEHWHRLVRLETDSSRQAGGRREAA